MSLILRNLDTKSEIPLEEGEPLIIGRGDVTGCSDKRVSRKHGKLVCTPEQKLQLTALHTNPCFIMKSGLPPPLQLKKDDEMILEDGDYIGLLPEACWFEIVKKDSSINNGVKKNSPEKVSVQDEPSTSSPLPKIKVSEDPTSNVPPELEKTRKLPLWMYEIDEPKETKKSPAKRPHSLGAEDSGGKKVKVELSPEVKLSPRVDRTSPSPERQTIAAEDVKVEVPDDNSTSRTEPNDEAKTENVNQAVTPKKENTEGESSKTNEKDGYESDIAEPEEPAAKNSSSPRRRPVCQYEGSCYRKNPQHKQEYSHPGDADYVRPESRPQCPYGASCYRQNAMHRVEYQHPTNTPAPRPQPQPQSPQSPGEERPPCQYGSLCYRQNPQHRRDFYHPPKGYSYIPQSCPFPMGGFTLPYIIVVPRWSSYNNSKYSSSKSSEQKPTGCDSTTHDREESDENGDSDSDMEFDEDQVDN